VAHHTGTPDTAQGDYPSLRIVRDGRSDLPGPLCNYGLGRNGTVYVVAAGVAWHAGPSSFAGFTNLNDTFLGIEAENAGGGRWPAAQLDAYPKLVAAILRHIGQDVNRYCSHRTCATPAGRKPDPTGIADTWMREQAAKYLDAPSPVEETPVPGPWITSGTWPPGTSAHQALCAPVGPEYLAKSGFLTLGVGWADATSVSVYFIGRPGANGQKVYLPGGARNFVLPSDSPRVWPIPVGTKQISVEYTSQNALGWCVETFGQ
jgi:hypothetical protein